MTATPSFPLTDRFTQALLLAARWHHGHFRDTTADLPASLPYLSQLLATAAIALDHGASEDEAIAALLHSAPTDGPQQSKQNQEALRGEMLNQFGLRVTVLVDDVTGMRQATALRQINSLSASSLLMVAADHLAHNRYLLSELLQLPAEQRQDYFAHLGSAALATLRHQQAVADQLAASPAVSERPRLISLLQQLSQSVDALALACGIDPEQLREGPPFNL